MSASECRFELALGDAGYPACVAELPDPPQRLYGRGDPAVLGSAALSVVGSRRPTPYGIAVAEMAARIAAESGVTVVSGGAVGCDQAAGRAAHAAGGRHVVVLGCGADVVYPRSARTLIERTLARGGAVISLEPWGAAPMRWTFPKRNRVIAALAAAVLVSEAGMPSGTFSTAETAMDLGREVLAVPGSILSPSSRGSNYLISVGACCIADEAALEMAISRIYGVLCLQQEGRPAPVSSAGPERRVLDMLAASPLDMEGIALALGLDGMAALRLMGSLEAAGLVERLVDGRFSPSAAALHARAGLGHNG